MNLLLVLSILAVSLAHKQTGKQTCACGWTKTEYSNNAYPWMVSIQERVGNLHLCGGAIITEWHVLTTAFCTVGYSATRLTTCVGAHDMAMCGKDDKSKYYDVHNIVKHNEFKREAKLNDISVITTKDQIIFNNEIGPACFPNVELANNVEGGSLKVMGRSKTETKILKELDVNVVPYSKCKTYFSLIDESLQICSQNPERNTCSGDFGGPLVWLDSATNKYLLVGIVSYCDEDYTKFDVVTLNTKVSPFYQWISGEIKAEKTQRLGYLCTHKS